MPLREIYVDVGGGGDYANFSAAYTAVNGAGNNIADGLRFYLVGTGVDTAVPTGATFTWVGSSEENRLYIGTPVAHRGATPWEWGTDRYRMSRAQGGSLWGLTRNVHLHLQGVHAENTRNNTDAGGFSVAHNAGNFSTLIEECRIRYSGGVAAGPISGAVVASSSTTSKVIVRKNIIEGWTGTTNGAGITPVGGLSGALVIADANTIRNCRTAIAQTGSNTAKARSNIISNCTNALSGTFADATHNVTDLASLGVGTGRTSQTFDFEDAAAGDFRLTVDDTAALGHGLNLSTDADNPHSTDFLQVPRGSLWDAGALQTTVPVVGSNKIVTYFFFN